MTVWNTSQFGWSSGQDVSNEFQSALANSFKAGDTLVVDGNYKISGAYVTLPENFTMVGENGGGFDVATSSSDSSVMFIVQSNSTISNMVFTADGAPSTGISHANPSSGTDYHNKRIIQVKGDDVEISDSSFQGNVGGFIDVFESKNVSVVNSKFDGGFYQVRVVGASDNMTVKDSQFVNALGDGIKTERYFGDGPVGLTVEGSLFHGNNRDGIDTAGGFSSGKILDSVFYDNGVAGVDLKKMLESNSDLDPSTGVSNVVIDGSTFVDNQNNVVVTMLDRIGALNSNNADELMPHDISVTNSSMEGTGRTFLIKDGYDITWENLTLYGDVEGPRIMNVSEPSGWEATNVGGSTIDGGGQLNKPASYYWSKDVGPSDKPSFSIDDTGAVVTEDLVEEEVEEPTSPSNPDAQEDHGAVGIKLLDIAGQHTINGSVNNVIELEAKDDFKTDSATISFSFNATTVQSNMGLVSRDAGGSDAGSGHFSSYIKAGTFNVRFQNGDVEKIFTLPGLKANQTYDVKASFGDGKVALWVDGTLIGEESMNMDWLTNDEYLQIGANGWASASGESGFRDVFQGSIGDVKILTGYNSTEADADTPDPVIDPPVVEEEPPVPAPVVSVDPVTGDNVLSEFEQTAITVTGTTENMEDGSRVNVVLWHGTSDFSFAGSTLVTDNTWSLTGIDVSNLPAGENYSIVATAQNESGTHSDQTSFFIEDVPDHIHVFAHQGEVVVDNNRNFVLEFQHTTDLSLEDAAISFTFNAENVQNRSGIVSKDAYGRFENDGHFSSWVHKGDLFVRFQEGRDSKTLKVEDIQTNEDYVVTASFKDGNVALHVNGVLHQESDFDFSWENNVEYLQIGANGWASQSGESGFRDVFDGTIENVVISDLENSTALEIHQMAVQDMFEL